MKNMHICLDLTSIFSSLFCLSLNLDCLLVFRSKEQQSWLSSIDNLLQKQKRFPQLFHVIIYHPRGKAEYFPTLKVSGLLSFQELAYFPGPSGCELLNPQLHDGVISIWIVILLLLIDLCTSVPYSFCQVLLNFV